MNDKAPTANPLIRVVARPADASLRGDIFGGWVISHMDIAGGIVAAEIAGEKLATVAIDAMRFLRPVRVGDILSIYGQIERTGRTSIAVHLEAWVRRGRIGDDEKVTEGKFTFVALDDAGRPKLVAIPKE
ncbi:acyl-CoA thioesterase [Salipiger abyssi]|uniref:acyl-CoA thioesterase n=1 Tax=Salipiger abyssi TaxID=1250539 RepID=UPI001A8F1691|nr:acyl-CoA thioesterase [Salipiger abyssi]MBN9886231.1 acyl-CoA thioesterase [Salipiger abyssi]